MKKFNSALLLVIALTGTCVFASEANETFVNAPRNSERENPYAPFEWLIGKWVGGVRQGAQASMTFEWGVNKTFIKYSGIRPINGKEVPEYEGMIAWHGMKEKMIVTSVYLSENRLVMEEGEFEVLPEGGVRKYFKVFYAAGEKLPWSDGKIAPKGGAALEFLQTWEPEDEDGLRDTFLMKKDGKWRSPHNRPEGFVWRRASTAEAAQEGNESLAALEPLIGKWRSSLDPRYKDHPMIKRFNPDLKPNELVFKWGEEKKIIHVADIQIDQPADGQNTRFIEGMVLWNPAEKKMVMVEYNVQDDLYFEGEYRILEDGKIIQRIYTTAFPDGSVGKFREQWVWDDLEKKSFKWITESFRNGKFVTSEIVPEYHRIGKD